MYGQPHSLESDDLSSCLPLTLAPGSPGGKAGGRWCRLSPGPPVLPSGSFFTVAQARAWLQEELRPETGPPVRWTRTEASAALKSVKATRACPTSLLVTVPRPTRGACRAEWCLPRPRPVCPPESVNGALFEKKALADVIKVRRSLPWTGWVLKSRINQISYLSQRQRNRPLHRRPCEDRVSRLTHPGRRPGKHLRCKSWRRPGRVCRSPENWPETWGLQSCGRIHFCCRQSVCAGLPQGSEETKALLEENIGAQAP